MTPESVATTRQHMLINGNGRMVQGSDIVTANQSIDVKTFDCAPNKRFFAINAAKHRQLDGQCDGYFALLAPKYARQALLIDILPYAAVSRWPCKPLGSYGDPSFNCPMHQILNPRQTFLRDFPQSRALLMRAA